MNVIPIHKMNLLRSMLFRKRLRNGAVLATALLTTSSASAFRAPSHAVAETPLHHMTAAHDGASGPPALSAQLRRDFVGARAAKARYDMPKLLSLVTDCRGLAFRMHKMRPAKICDEAMFGVAQRLGDARVMIEAAYWWQQHGFSEADKTSKVYLAFQKANLAQLVDTVPAFSVTLAGSPTVLKYQHRIESVGSVPAEPLAWHRPNVTATINDKPVVVLVDTGTVVPLTVDQTNAAALGAMPLFGDLVAPVMGKASQTETQGFTHALIDTFKFGGLVMHNVAATVVPDGTFSVGILVGLPVLARFGRVDLNNKRIAVGSAAPHCARGTPLEFVGEGQLGFSTTANGQPSVAFVDTGDVNALTTKSQLKTMPFDTKNMNSLELRDGAETHHRLRIQIGSWSMTEINVPDGRRAPGAKRALPPGVDVNIGAPLLALADVQIDFSKPSLCVSPKPAVKDGAVIVIRN